MLEDLNIIRDDSSEESTPAEGSVVGDGQQDSANETRMGGVEEEQAVASRNVMLGMHNRGLPYFEELVEHSRLGRIKRRKGGHVSGDGRTTVEWEVIEIGGDEPMETSQAAASNKRQKTDG